MAEPVHLAHSGREIRQVLENVDGEDAIKVPVGKIEPALTVTDVGVDLWKTFTDARCHVLAQFEGDVVSLLLVTKLFVGRCSPRPAPISSVVRKSRGAHRTG
jgi:hypothetical protein